MRQRHTLDASQGDTTRPRDAVTSSQHRDWRMRVLRVYHWSLWTFLVLLLLLQPLGFVWRTLASHSHVLFGRSPVEGPFTVVGSTNDDPFTDRAIVCSLVGRLYKPTQLSTLLATTPPNASDVSGPAYRVIPREGLELATDVRGYYANVCDQIAMTIDGMMAACTTLGYNVSGVDYLRVVTGSSDAHVALPSTLPVLILPYYDNARRARAVVPGHDGRACMFRLSGKYDDAALPNAYLSGIDRTVREQKTVEWLELAREGVWRHGWYEDPTTHARWYSDVYSTESPGAFGISRRQFETNSGTESDCVHTTDCKMAPTKVFWGKDLFVIDQQLWGTSITILDEKRNGLFMYEGEKMQHTFNTYRLEILIANLSVTLLLFRWLVALVATQRVGQSIGIGALSCARSFHVLPIVLLPRMKMIFAAFWTVGCRFEGDQSTLSEAWFVMYPAIAEFTLLYFSLLNLAAKVLRRRVSDALFGPTLLSLLLLHRMRSPIADSGLFEMSGRVATSLSSARFDNLRLVDLLSPTVMFQLNGMVPSIFGMKIALLVLNIVPCLVFSLNTSTRSRARAGVVRCEAEKSLALRVACSGGLGLSLVYDMASAGTQAAKHSLDVIVPIPPKTSGTKANLRQQTTQQSGNAGTLLPYELARSGYVVLGQDALVSMKDWFWFMVSAPCRAIGIPMRHLRMVTFSVAVDGSKAHPVWVVSERPSMCRVTDDRFHGVGAWEISVRPLR